MKRESNRAVVAAAAARLEHVRRAHRGQTAWLRDAVHERRGLFAIAGGLAGGLVLGRLPVRAWLRSGLSALATAAAIARTPLGPIALGAFMARRKEPDEPPSR